MSAALVIGEALVDVVRSPDGSTREHAGGSPANVAYGLALLGREVSLGTWFGRDAHGELLSTHLQRAGVQITDGSDRAERTSTALAELNEGGSAQYTFELDWQLPEVAIPADIGLIHFGSIAAMLPPGGPQVQSLVRSAAGRATISYDPNLRPSIIGLADEVRDEIEGLVAHSDIVKISDEDLEWLYPGQDPGEVAIRWQETGPAFVVVSRGAQGSLGVTATEQFTVPSPRVEVVDTVGAGDSYMSALLDAIWEADLVGVHRREALHAIETNTLRAAMRYAGRLAAATVSRAGANPPTREEAGPIEGISTARDEAE